ncbi:MAG TPA: PAS domain S-box protein [Mucilaginibacter sp.]
MNDREVNLIFDLEFFFNLSPDLLCIAGFDGYFKKINPAVSKTLGYTQEELFAKPIDSFVHADDRQLTSNKRKLLTKNSPLLNFENRYISKTGEIVWLTWTSMPVKEQELVFAIAKNITHGKRFEEYKRISVVMSKHEHHAGMEGEPSTIANSELSVIDQDWLNQIDLLIRKFIGKTELNITWLSKEMAVSERQLFRHTKAVTGVTPNKFIRVICLQLAMEAINSGKYSTVSEIALAAGFKTPAYFNKLFKDVYLHDVGELLNHR